MTTRWSPRVSGIISSQNDFELAGLDASVAEALTLIERKSPQVVLMDYHLLDGDGEQILQCWPV
jgi:response regulator of citrate/malate metabolism